MATCRPDERLDDDPAPRARPSPPPRRPEMDDWLNAHVYHPLARRLAALFARTPISPNAVSIAGGTMIVVAGILYVGLSWPLSAALGFLAHASWHVLDGADGDLARLTGKASPLGEMVDGVCDYAGHFILYFILAVSVQHWPGWVWALGTAAGLSRAVQANHSESGRRTYLWRVYGVPWLKQVYQADDDHLRRGAFARLFGPFARFYVRLASAGSPLAARVDALMEAATQSPAGAERARRVCREESRIPLRLQTILGANGRTVALGLSMAAGSPLWFFGLEATALNLLLLVSIFLQRRCDRRIVRRLEANAAILGG